MYVTPTTLHKTQTMYKKKLKFPFFKQSSNLQIEEDPQTYIIQFMLKKKYFFSPWKGSNN